MSNASFLSDSLKSNFVDKVEVKQCFTSANEIQNLDTKKFESEKYNTKICDKYVMKSATARKWSIKFK